MALVEKLCEDPRVRRAGAACAAREETEAGQDREETCVGPDLKAGKSPNEQDYKTRLPHPRGSAAGNGRTSFWPTRDKLGL